MSESAPPQPPTNSSSAAEPDRTRRDALGDDVAYARLELIGPLFDTALSRRQRWNLAKDLARRGWTHPILGPHSLHPRTVWRWYEAFKKRGFDGLRPRYSADRGELRAFSDTVLTAAVVRKRELLTRTVGRVIELLEIDKQSEPLYRGPVYPSASPASGGSDGPSRHQDPRGRPAVSGEAAG